MKKILVIGLTVVTAALARAQGWPNAGNDIVIPYNVAAGTSALVWSPTNQVLNQATGATNAPSVFAIQVENTGAVWAAVHTGNFTNIVNRGPAARSLPSQVLTNIDITVTNLTGTWLAPTNGTDNISSESQNFNTEIRIVADSHGAATGSITLKPRSQ